jgi:hypothetical protein
MRFSMKHALTHRDDKKIWDKNRKVDAMAKAMK